MKLLLRDRIATHYNARQRGHTQEKIAAISSWRLRQRWMFEEPAPKALAEAVPWYS